MTTDKNIGGIFEERTCCICGKKFYAPHGIGNNPDPVYPAIEMENGDGKLVHECCDKYAATTVLDARLVRGKTGDFPESRINYFAKAMKNGEWI